MSEIVRHPEWKHALEQFFDAGYSYGSRIDDEWFYRAFGLQMPTRDMPAWEAQRLELARLRNFESMRRWLLAEHRMLLDRRSGVVEVVRPQEQTAYAMSDFHEELTKGFLRAADRLRYTAVEVLDDEQQRRHADACAKLAQLKGMLLGSRKRSPELPRPDSDS